MNISRLNLLIEQSLVSGTNFTASLWVAREYGAGSLTYYTLILSILFYINSVQHSLLFSYLFSRSYLLARFRFIRSLNIQVNISVLLFFMLSLVGAASLFSAYISVFEVFLLILFFLVLNAHEFLRKYLIYERRSWILILGAIFVNLLPLSLFIFFSGLGVIGYFVMKVVFSMAFFMGVVTFFRFNVWRFGKLLRFGRNWNKHYQFGKWLVLGSSLQWTSGYVFLYGAALIIGSEAAGYVIAIKSLFGLTSLLYQYYESAIPPFIKRHPTVAKRVESVCGASIETFVMCGLFLIAINILSDEIIISVLGDNYADFSWLVLWFSIITLCEMVQRPLLVLLRSFDATAVIFRAYAVSSMVALAMVVPLVSLFGQLGVVIGLLALQLMLVTCYALGLTSLFREEAAGER